MPNQSKKYAVMFIPKTGLLYSQGEFLDGNGEPLKWDRSMRMYASYQRAMQARDRILGAHPQLYNSGNLIVITIEPVEVKEAELAAA